jgi:hypothetical protein
MARSGEGGDTEWEILLSAEVESFLDHLYESDPASLRVRPGEPPAGEPGDPGSGAQRPCGGSPAG